MATQFKTRCPHCAAQFKITEEHLKQANGAVRCGSCLQIFQATDHLVDPPAADTNTSADRWAGALDTNATTPPPTPRDSKPRLEEEPEPDADNLSMEGMELSDSFMNLEEGSSEEGLGEDFSDMAGAGRSTHNEGADESWAEALLNELEDEDEPETQEPATPPRANFAPQDEQQPSSQSATPAPAQRTASKPAPEPESDSLFGGLDLFGDDLNDEPVAFPSKPVRERDLAFKPSYDWQGLVKWTLLSAFAAIILVGQYAWFNFDHLARSPQWRPAYQQACEALGCKLPSRSDISKLRGANLVVRSHPEYSNALIVDAILFNEARYPQPFPDLELRFSALDGKAVASRRFKPEEYLQGDLKGMDSMPTNTPLHVSLEIVDPGDSAVNYNLRLLPSLKNPDQISQR
ncbi:zinc-ribbon and DUF3426 domain-containing protein [Alcanivorax sp. DP30]|uniref:zinc-ribbon and DUF3426 domain-containing protein n=1 Tax=Alcanivorax sp. DP30 TaxID=2606217 RepID=UPI0013696972|nr:zinc-ribbon and DUF3426 domain-containing protein [Alcanivorax sp. DP30]MZR63644.1 DUF3426 domain-containing protein [Alcanivorax sp. DP30]